MKRDQMRQPKLNDQPAVVDMQCLVKAVTSREDALIAASSANAEAISAAFSHRKTALLAAYAQTDKAALRKAVAAAWKSFDADRKTAGKAWMTSRSASWQTFRTSAKACGAADMSGAESGMEEVSPMMGE